MSSTTTKGQIGNKDIKWWDGITDTFTRETSTGGLLTLNKIGTEVFVDEAYGSGAISESALNTAINQIGTTRKRIITLREGTWSLTSNLTIPSNITLKLLPGATIGIPTGVTLTINGPIEAGSYQIFSCTGSGTVADDCLTQGYAEWWGAVGDDSTDDFNALNYCMAACRKTILLDKTYKITDSLVLPEKHEITGNGDLSVIHQATAGTATGSQPYSDTGYGILCKNYAKVYNFCLKGTYDELTIDSSSRAINWYSFDGAAWATRAASEFTGNYVTVENMTIQDWGCDGICGSSYWIVKNNRISHCYLEGIIFQGSYNMAVNNQITNIFSWGIDLNGSGNVIEGNRISTVGQASLPGGYRYDGGGIVSMAASVNMMANGNRIVNNIIDDTGECRGIFVYHNLASGTSYGNLVSGNYIYQSGTSLYNQGIAVQGTATTFPTGTIVTNNYIQGCYKEAMFIQYAVDTTISGNTMEQISQSNSIPGMTVDNVTDFTINNNTFKNNPKIALTDAIVLSGTTTYGKIIGNFINANWVYGVKYDGTDIDYISCTNNTLIGLDYPIGFINDAPNLTITNEGNSGWNPRGNVAFYGATPPYGGPDDVPASETAYQNPYTFGCMVAIVGGTVTAIEIGDTEAQVYGTGLTTGTFIVPANHWIKITYSVVPTWKWWGIQ